MIFLPHMEKTLKNAAGVYAIENMTTGLVYIGSSVCFTDRWSAHKCKLRRNRHDNPLLQADWNIYGEEMFSHRVLEVISHCKPTKEQEKVMLAAERKWIAAYEDRCYNLHRIGNGPRRKK